MFFNLFFVKALAGWRAAALVDDDNNDVDDMHRVKVNVAIIKLKVYFFTHHARVYSACNTKCS